MELLVFPYATWFGAALSELEAAVADAIPVILILAGSLLAIDLIWAIIKRFASGD